MKSDPDREIAFVKGILNILDWPALVKGANEMGLNTLPPILTQDLTQNPAFLRALYHVLMNVHLINGILTCPDTGKEFPVSAGVCSFLIDEDDCENVRF